MSRPRITTLPDILKDLRRRLLRVERRLQRLASGGLTPQEVTDWDDALEPGYYWGYDAANGPEEAPGEPNLGWTTGYVMKFDQGGPQERTYQVVRECRATNITSEYIRYGSSIIQGAWTRVGGDTGWVDASSWLNSGFSGTLQYRRFGEQVYLRADVSGTFGPYNTSFATASASFTPSNIGTGGAFMTGGDGDMAVAYVTDSSNIGVRQLSTTTIANRARFTFPYIL